MRTNTLALVLLCGCASASRPSINAPTSDRILGVNTDTREVMHTQSSTGPAVASIHAPLSAVWAALPDVYNALGIELTVIDPPTATIGNRAFNRTRTLAGKRLSAYFDCGSSMTGTRADEGRMIISTMSKATAGAAGETSLATTVTGVVQTTDGASAQTIPCASTGVLEASIQNAVLRRTGGS